jgi:hypothetical protein
MKSISSILILLALSSCSSEVEKTYCRDDSDCEKQLWCNANGEQKEAPNQCWADQDNYVRCERNSQCISNYCDEYKKVCKPSNSNDKQSNGGSSNYVNEGGSENNGGKGGDSNNGGSEITGNLKPGEICLVSSQCESLLCSNNICLQNNLNVDEACEQKEQCQTKICLNKKCAINNLQNGLSCEVHEQCKEKLCSFGTCVGGFTKIYNGTLDGWKVVNLNGWITDGEILKTTKQTKQVNPSSWLQYAPPGSTGKFNDFEFYVEWKADPATTDNMSGNSGLMFDIPKDPLDSFRSSIDPYRDGVEIQITNDPDYANYYGSSSSCINNTDCNYASNEALEGCDKMEVCPGGTDITSQDSIDCRKARTCNYTTTDVRERSGSIYGFVGVSSSAYLNDWNAYHLKVKGQNITLIFNGKEVLNVNRDDYKNRVMVWPTCIPGSSPKVCHPLKSLFDRPEEGFIGLQIHRGNPVYFKNIFIKPL